jgi:hypothetical protein
MQKPDHISATQIETGKCLYKYYRLRLLKDIGEDTLPKRLGKCVHDVISNYTDHCVKNKIDGDFEQLELLIQKYADEYKIPDGEYHDMRRNLCEFGEQGINFDTILEYEVEQNVEFLPGKKIIVKLDRLDSFVNSSGHSVLRIRDYKNSMKIYSAGDVEESMQLKIYKIIAAFFLYPGFDYIQVGIHHTRYNFVRWGELERIKDLGTEREEMINFLDRQYSRLLETEDYQPEKGESCWKFGGCEVMVCGECPAYKGYDKKNYDDFIDAEILEKARAAKYYDIQAKELSKDVRLYFKDAKCEELDGTLTGYHSTESFGYNLGKFVKFAEREGIDLNDLEIGKTAAEKALKKSRKLRDYDPDELEKIKVYSKRTTFKM